jgi:single-strand DNA-binding protein
MPDTQRNVSTVTKPERAAETSKPTITKEVLLMYQQLTLIGNLGNDPEMRYTATGDPVTNFRLAVNRRWTREDGQTQEKTTWFHVTAWRRQAEWASQYLTKGRRILLIGEIEGARAYMDREGNPRANIDLTAREIRFLDARAPGQDEGTPVGHRHGEADPEEEVIPF